MPRPKIDVLRGPDHLAPAGNGRGTTVRPAAARVARPLSGLSDVAREAIAKTCGTISTTARMKPDQPFRSYRAGANPSIRPFFLTQGLPRHQKCLEEISSGSLAARIALRTNRLVVACTVIERWEVRSGHCSDPESLL
jgi:hypothetical protein